MVIGLSLAMAAAQPGMPPGMPPEPDGSNQPDLRLEFHISDIGQRVEIPDLTEILYHDIISKVDEKDIVGLQAVPQRWPRKVIVHCAHRAAKDCLLIQGLDIYGRHIVLNEPSQGLIKVLIQDAPLGMPNGILQNWISQFGTIVDFKDEYLFVRGRKTRWRTGTRVVHMRALRQPIPPAAKIKSGDRDVSISVWHYGQSHIRCRFCNENVPKGHRCDKGPRKKCYDCGSEDHVKAKCTVGKCCFKCGKNDHLAKDCGPTIMNTDEYPPLGSPANPSSGQDARSQGQQALTSNSVHQGSQGENNHQSEAQAGTTDATDPDSNVVNGAQEETMISGQSRNLDSSTDSLEIDDSEKNHDHQLEVLLIGGANCQGISLDGDDQLKLNTVSLTQGCLKINEISEKTG